VDDNLGVGAAVAVGVEVPAALESNSTAASGDHRVDFRVSIGIRLLDHDLVHPTPDGGARSMKISAGGFSPR
jgi:hypothetical protein